MAYCIEDLEKILEEDFIDNPDAFAPGRRNDDAVDMTIIARILGVNPWKVLEDIEAKQGGWSPRQEREITEHMDRVEPYAEGWCSAGDMDGLRFAINY